MEGGGDGGGDGGGGDGWDGGPPAWGDTAGWDSDYTPSDSPSIRGLVIFLVLTAIVAVLILAAASSGI